MLNWIVIIILGLFMGVLVNYLADVMPITRKLSEPVCISCQNMIPWDYYLTFKKCPHCDRNRRLRSWITLISFPILFLFLRAFPNDRLVFWEGVVVLSYFSLVLINDIEYRVVLQPVIIFGGVIFLFLGWRLHGIVNTILGFMVGFGVMFVIYYLGTLFIKFTAKRRMQETTDVALGFGDVNLGGVIGLILGWPGIFAGLIMAIVFAGIFSGIYLLFSIVKHEYQHNLAIPYAPFMVLGTLVLLLRP
ncbi:MAG: prepilin peptidase [Anaerolineaceae bacterium]|nr:prepilin peptidase [Anaerolineaceae bacterium]